MNRLSRSVSSAVLVMALCLMAIALLSACDDKPQPVAKPEPTCTRTSTAADDSPDPSVSDELRSTQEQTAPSATEMDAELVDLVNGNSAFAFDLYRALCVEDGNLFYSPYSISLALAMTYAGARGETERQMAGTLHFLLPQDRLHPAFNDQDIRLASRAGDQQGDFDTGFRLNIANALWGQKGYEFVEEFLNVLSENYGAGVRPMDFMTMPEESRLTINDWVADRTEDRIKDLIPQGVINEFTRLVLTNAVYFNAKWRYTFDESSTLMRPFHLLDGGEVHVQMMMSEPEFFGYAKGEGYQAVDLPYVGGALSMTILLPDEGRFREFEKSINAVRVGRILEDIEGQLVELTMPRFEFESQFMLVETLEKMGMPNAFDDRTSDFSGMDGTSCLAGDVPCLLISDVIHKAFVSVDEEGTEAAAVTAGLFFLNTAGVYEPQLIRVTVDRPFIFLIRDRATNTILFVGRMEKPEEKAQ